MCEAIEIFLVVLSNLAIFLWCRTESRIDWRHMDAKLDAIQAEIKDFHERLLEIERGRTKL